MELQIDEPLQTEPPNLDVLPDGMVIDVHAEVDLH